MTGAHAEIVLPAGAEAAIEDLGADTARYPTSISVTAAARRPALDLIAMSAADGGPVHPREPRANPPLFFRFDLARSL